MSVLVFAIVNVKNPEKFAEYGQKAAETFGPYGGEVIVRGKYVSTLVGSEPHSAGAVIRFPNKSSVDEWYASDAYQAIIPLRDAAADMTLTIFDAIS